MKIFKNYPKNLIALLLLALTITATVPKLPTRGLSSECSVCGDNEDERPCPEKTIPGK